MGSLKSPCATSYRSSIATIALNCLVFEKVAFFAFLRQTDKLTDGQTDGQLRRTKQGSRIRSVYVFYIFEGYVHTLTYSILVYVNNNRIRCNYNTIVYLIKILSKMFPELFVAIVGWFNATTFGLQVNSG